MITILEGPDGGGKSTLARALGQPTYAHGPYPKRVRIAELYARSLFEGRENDAVLDRSWLSESIYGGVYREGADRIGVGYGRLLERIAWSVQAVVVLCLPSWETVLKSWGTREEYLDDTKQLRQVYDAYTMLHQATDLPLVRYDYTRHSVDHLRRQIRQARPRANRGPGIGRWEPGEVSMVVGELVSFRRTNYSAWLADELERSRVYERSLYWVNATRHGSLLSVQSGGPSTFLEELHPLHVVALGRIAASWCRSVGLSFFAEIPHPQYWKRFHRHAAYPLGTTLTRRG